MKFIGDYHTHSKRSDGKQTEEQIINAAKKKGLREVAITDHGPLAVGIGVKSSKEYLELKRKVEELDQENGPFVFIGAEANIRDTDGTLDIPSEIIEDLDLLIVGLHPYTLPENIKDGVNIFVKNSLRHFGKNIKEKAVDSNTKATVEALYNNPQVDIISHPGLFFNVHMDELAKACVKNDVLFEINCGHEHPAIFDIMEADRHGVDFIVNSDAHSQDTVGNLEYGSKIIEKLKIDPNQVKNRESGEELLQWGKKWRAYTYL